MMKIYFFLLLIGNLLIAGQGFAAWNRVAPRSIQDTNAKKIAHNDRGLRRIVRVDGITVCLADGVANQANHEGIYRSSDNGLEWELIGSIPGTSRGTIITGPDRVVFIFWVLAEGNDPGIYFTKFRIDQTPPPPRPIFQGYVKSVGYEGGYQDISAAIDRKGTIFVAAHYPKIRGDVDGIWLLKSSDQGNTWVGPKIVAYEENTSFAYPSLEVDHGGSLIMAFAEHSPEYLGGREDDEKRIYFMRSDSEGNSWRGRVLVDSIGGPFRVYNPCLVEDIQGNLYVFGQRAFQGLVMAKSEDLGRHWTGFSLIVPTGNYADPSAAIGSDNTIYIVYRDDKICNGVSANTYHAAIAASKNQGRSWHTVYRYCEQGKAGPGLSLRYANWWNYGGPLEWCWQQYLKQDRHIKPVYYAINPAIKIFNRTTSERSK